MPLSIGIGISPTKISDAVSALFSGIPTPTWAIDFARDPYASLHPAFSHVRATESTLIQQYDGSFVQMLPNEFGLDGGRRVENLLSDTADFSAAAWTKLRATIDGDAIVETATTGAHGAYQIVNSIPAGKCFAQAKVKAEGRGFAYFEMAGSGNAYINLSTGEINNASPQLLHAAAELQPDGYWLISGAVPYSVAGNRSAAIYAATAAGTNSYAGTDGLAAIRVKDLMLELVPDDQEVPSEYVSKGVEILGAEQLTNGDFSDGLTGWTVDAGTGSVVVVDGRARMSTVDVSDVMIQTSFVAQAGREYRITTTQYGAVGGGASVVYVGKNPGAVDYLNVSLAGNQTHSSTFTANASGVVYIQVIQYATGPAYADLDNISVKPILHHGWGVDGVRWFNTGPSGEDLTDPASGFPVLCTGLATRQQVTNLWPYANAATADISITSGGLKDAPGFGGFANSLEYDNSSQNAYAIESLALTGDHVIQAIVKMNDGGAPVPATGATDAVGDIVINAQSTYIAPTVEALGNGLYLVWAMKTGSGSAGNWGIAQYTGNSGRTFKSILIQVHAGTKPKPFVLTEGLSATADADVIPLDKDALPYDATGGDFIIEHTPMFDGPVNSSAQHLLDLWGGSTSERMAVYNRNGDLGVVFRDNGVAQWDGSDPAGRWVAGVEQRVAVKVVEDNGVLVADGVELLSDSSMTLATVTDIYLGGQSTSEYSGSIARIAYYGGA